MIDDPMPYQIVRAATTYRRSTDRTDGGRGSRGDAGPDRDANDQCGGIDGDSSSLSNAPASANASTDCETNLDPLDEQPKHR